MRFTIWRAKNGWVAIRGDHDYINEGDMPQVHVFTTALKLATWLSKQK